MIEAKPPGEKNIEERELELEYVRLAQEKYLREKELDNQLLQSKKSVWSTPWITALIAGAIGLFGTLWNSYQGLLLEGKKQEGTLILEAIKTGTGETKSAASNLLFLNNAGLISLNEDQRNKLEQEAGANPLPSLPGIKETISYEPSSEVTSTIKEILQATVDSYLNYLSQIGYEKSKMGLKVFINPELEFNIVYNVELDRLEIPPKLVESKDGVLQQYTTRILVESGIGTTRQDTMLVENSLIIGLSDYFTCSYQNDPVLGEDFINILNRNEKQLFDSPYLRNLNNQQKLNHQFKNPYEHGEAWGGAFWEMRNQIGKLSADRLLFLAWKRINKKKISDSEGRFFFSEIIQADKDLNKGRHLASITSVFKNRNLIK